MFSLFSPGSFNPFKGRQYLTEQDFNRRVDNMNLRTDQEEYTKAHFAKFSNNWSRGITEREFNTGLQELRKNQRDSLGRGEVERIEKKFGAQPPDPKAPRRF